MIQDYSELIMEVSRRTGKENISERAGQLVGLAERSISKKLRIIDQEKQSNVTTDGNGIVDIPSDLQEIRSVFVNDKKIDRKSINVVLEKNQDGFAVLGRKLHSSYKNQEHKILYFADIPSLEVNDTNFLLQSDPEIYLQAVMFQIYSAENDIEKATTINAYLNLLIDETNQVAVANRHQDAIINFEGIMP